MGIHTELARDYRAVFSTPAGRRVLAHLYRTHFEARQADTLFGVVGVAERRGKQAVISSILRKMNLTTADRIAFDATARAVFEEKREEEDD